MGRWGPVAQDTLRTLGSPLEPIKAWEHLEGPLKFKVQGGWWEWRWRDSFLVLRFQVGKERKEEHLRKPAQVRTSQEGAYSLSLDPLSLLLLLTLHPNSGPSSAVSEGRAGVPCGVSTLVHYSLCSLCPPYWTNHGNLGEQLPDKNLLLRSLRGGLSLEPVFWKPWILSPWWPI